MTVLINSTVFQRSFNMTNYSVEYESKDARLDWLPSNLKRLTPAGYDVAFTLLTIISVFGIFNNLCVICVIIKNRALRTPVNLMLLNLSISDMMLAAFGSPLAAAAALQRGWYMVPELCIAEGFGMAVGGIASITSLAVISFERFLLITRPGSIDINKTKAVFGICGVWLYALFVTFPPLVGWSRYSVESPGIACAIDWEVMNPEKLSYVVYLFIFGLVVPVMVIVYCYYKILKAVRQQSRSAAGGGVAKSQRKVTLMVIMMVAAFLVAWLPYAVVSLIVVFGGEHLISATSATAPAIFAKASIIYNPIIYVLMNPPFRQAFVSFFTCGFGHIPSPNELLGRQVAPKSTDVVKTGDETFKKTEVGSKPTGSGSVENQPPPKPIKMKQPRAPTPRPTKIENDEKSMHVSNA